METRKVPARNGKGVTYTNGDGYYFKVNNRRNGNVYMLCVDCNVRGKLEGDRLVVNNDREHIHPPDQLLEKTMLLKQAFKEESKQLLGSDPRKVFTNTCSKADTEARGTVSFESCRSSMYRARAGLHPPVPKDLAELHSHLTDEKFLEKYGKCPDGSLMSRGLVGPPEHESLVFTSDVMLNILVAAAWLFIDGTFAIRPDSPATRQLLVISALYQGMIFPVCFSLMASKAEAAYRALFAFLKELQPLLAPENIVTDFEAALVAPIRDLFPSTIHQGCFFHFCQALHRNIGFLGLLTVVKSNYNAQTVVRMCYVLPLLPYTLIENGLNAIEYVADMNGLLETLQPFLNYIRQIWLGRIGAKLISVYRSKHRTNNYSESGHKALQDRIKSIRPGTYDFVGAINTELAEAHLDVIRLQSNQATKRNRTAKWIRQDAQISMLLDRLDAGQQGRAEGITVLEFLIKAQNAVRKLQYRQFYLPTDSLPEADEYPVQLQAVDDPLEEEPQQVDAEPPQDELPDEGQAGPSQGQAGPSQGQAGPSQGQAGTSQEVIATQMATPLLMPPANINFAVRLGSAPVSQGEAEDLFASQQRRPASSPLQEPDVSPVRGRRRGRPRLPRPAGVGNSTRGRGRGRGRPRGSRARGGRGRGAATARVQEPATSESESEPEALPEDFLSEEEVRARREHQHAVQEAAQAAARAAATCASTATATDEECLLCCDAKRTHAAAPCGHRFCCEACAAKLQETVAMTCAICRDDALFLLRIIDS